MFTATQPIRDIVAKLEPAAAILARFEIDSTMHGDQNLQQACSAAQLSVEQVLEKLEDAVLNRPNPNELSLTRLIQHIVRVHHRYLREQLPQLIGHARNASTKTPAKSTAWIEVTLLLEQLRTSMAAHFEKEEQILFPYIAQLDDDPGLACLPPDAGFTSMSESIIFMAKEHEFIDAALRAIDVLLLALDENEPGRGFAAAFQALKTDLDTHVHIEDYCLFPRAISVEWAARQGN
jgi:regulator of cell morphogenesis and NO signaling